MNNQENNQPTKPLSEYTDNELANEITRRINNFSLDLTRLLIPMCVIASQHYQWYQEKRETKEKKNTG